MKDKIFCLVERFLKIYSETSLQWPPLGNEVYRGVAGVDL